MSVCYIVGAGECERVPKICKGDFLIAADGGYDALKRQNITPDLLVGDLDSINNLPSGIETLRFKPQKDETDMHLSYLEGAKRGYTHFEIYGGTGGRSDHTFANYSLLLYIANNGHTARLIGKHDTALVIKNGETVLDFDTKGKYFSIFAIGGDAHGVTIKNAKYEVENASLTPDFPLGVSNEFCDTPPIVKVECGAVLIICEG